MESQPQNPEFRNNPENYNPCISWFSMVRVKKCNKIAWMLDVYRVREHVTCEAIFVSIIFKGVAILEIVLVCGKGFAFFFCNTSVAKASKNFMSWPIAYVI